MKEQGKSIHLPSDGVVEGAAKDYSLKCYEDIRKTSEIGFIACWKWFRQWRENNPQQSKEPLPIVEITEKEIMNILEKHLDSTENIYGQRDASKELFVLFQSHAQQVIAKREEEKESIVEKLESLSNRYEVIDGIYVIRKTDLDVQIEEIKQQI